MFEASGIYKRFGKFEVLSDITFHTEPGEIYGLIGYNGVGKTTLLKICCGIYRPDRGTVKIEGKPVFDNPDIKQRCFFMTEEPPFLDGTSLNDMRSFFAGYYPSWNDNTFKQLISWFGLDPGKTVSQFSKGMQRQASLCIAMASRAEYLFLDEAFDGLDHSMRKMVSDMLLFYAREKKAAVIISSHNLHELEGLADRIGMLNEGCLTYDNTVSSIQAEYSILILKKEYDPADPGSLPEPVLSEIRKDGTVLYMFHENTEKLTGRAAPLADDIIQIRPAGLEEYFSLSRRPDRIDWNEVFA